MNADLANYLWHQLIPSLVVVVVVVSGNYGGASVLRQKLQCSAVHSSEADSEPRSRLPLQ